MSPDLLAVLKEITTHLEAQALGYLAPELWPHTRERLIAEARRVLEDASL